MGARYNCHNYTLAYHITLRHGLAFRKGILEGIGTAFRTNEHWNSPKYHASHLKFLNLPALVCVRSSTGKAFVIYLS